MCVVGCYLLLVGGQDMSMGLNFDHINFHYKLSLDSRKHDEEKVQKM